MSSMICCSQAAAATGGDMQGDHCAIERTACCAKVVAALARCSTLKSSSCAPTPPAKSLDRSPPTWTMSKTVLSYWLGVRRPACSTGACFALQSVGITLPEVAPPGLLVAPVLGPAPEELADGPVPPICPVHPASAPSATNAGTRASLKTRLRAFMRHLGVAS